MPITRRNLLQTGFAAGAALVGARAAIAQPHAGHGARPPRGESYKPVIVPNGSTLPFEHRNGWKVFHLIAEPIEHELTPGLRIEAWGYNGSTPGPLIEAVEGDKVRIYVTNKLKERTSVH